MNHLKVKIRFSDVAAAIDLTPKAFRNWLQRYDLHLMSNHKTRGWTDFTLGDVAILAITREIVRWGVGVEAANETAFLLVHRKASLLLEYRNTPAGAMVAALQGVQLCINAPDDPEGPFALDPAIEPLGPDNFKSSLWVTPHHIVTDAFQRLGALDASTDEADT